MAIYIQDITKQQTVVKAPIRAQRPRDLGANVLPQCPFCEGNEATTPPEVFRIGAGEVNKPGWDVRVVPNKFPITDIHEVIIHSLDHEKDLAHLELEHIDKVLTTYIQRFQTHALKGSVMIFCNQGINSGASLKHSHSQVCLLPPAIPLHTLTLQPKENVVIEDEYFAVYCPTFSQYAHEVWIAPKSQGKTFGDITANERNSLAMCLKNTLVGLGKVKEARYSSLPDFSYNFYISPGTNWYLRIIPRFVGGWGGFEFSTGVLINEVDAQLAAQELQTLMLRQEA